MAAVFPGFDALATAAFDEGHVLRTATESLASLRADVARLAGELAEAREIETRLMRQIDNLLSAKFKASPFGDEQRQRAEQAEQRAEGLARERFCVCQRDVPMTAAELQDPTRPPKQECDYHAALRQRADKAGSLAAQRGEEISAAVLAIVREAVPVIADAAIVGEHVGLPAAVAVVRQLIAHTRAQGATLADCRKALTDARYRMTEAALADECHHCGEEDDGPCWWCGRITEEAAAARALLDAEKEKPSASTPCVQSEAELSGEIDRLRLALAGVRHMAGLARPDIFAVANAALTLDVREPDAPAQETP
jgi:hypothetical protein